MFLVKNRGAKAVLEERLFLRIPLDWALPNEDLGNSHTHFWPNKTALARDNWHSGFHFDFLSENNWCAPAVCRNQETEVWQCQRPTLVVAHVPCMRPCTDLEINKGEIDFFSYPSLSSFLLFLLFKKNREGAQSGASLFFPGLGPQDPVLDPPLCTRVMTTRWACLLPVCLLARLVSRILGNQHFYH